MDEASKTAKLSADDGDESGDASSSEDDTAIPTSSNKAMQIIQEQDNSPSPRRLTEGEQREKEIIKEGKEKSIITSNSPNVKSKGALSSNPAYKSTKSTQNKSIINLKTINSCMEPASKSNSPRKSEVIRNQGFFRETIGGSSPIRRSLKQN